MKPFSGNIARKIIITYSSLALVVVVVSASSIAGIRYARQTILVEAFQRQEVALFSARIRSEALLLTNAVQQYAVSAENGQAERQAINDQIALLENLLQQAAINVNPNDVDESISVGLIRQYLVAFNVQSRHVLDTSDAENGLGTDTAREMDILLNHYQPALIQSLETFEKLERDAAEKSIARAELYATQIAVLLSAVSALAIIIASAMSLWLTKRFVIPLTALTEHVKAFPDTSRNAPPKITTDDEMGALSHALNRMEAEIHESHQELERYAATLETQVEERTRELKLLAITDSLTGIYTRRHFFALAEQSFSEADRLNHSFSIAIFDVDHFKTVNDCYGHAVGDRVLKQAVQIMKLHIRQMDIIGRYGGEEFVVALPSAGIEESLQITKRIAATLRETQFECEGQHFGITVSGGIAERINTSNESLEDVLLKADKALYNAKGKGRDMVIAFQPAIADKETI